MAFKSYSFAYNTLFLYDLTMEPSKWAKEMSFPRPHHAVELVERALDVGSASVICVANNESKLFIAFQLFQEFGRRGKTAGKMVLLVDDESGKFGLMAFKVQYLNVLEETRSRLRA